MIEFKEEAAGLVEGGQSQASVAKTLGLAENTLFNFKGADSKPVSAEQVEITPLRAELAG